MTPSSVIKKVGLLTVLQVSNSNTLYKADLKNSMDRVTLAIEQARIVNKIDRSGKKK